jgi:hypothetical protein
MEAVAQELTWAQKAHAHFTKQVHEDALADTGDAYTQFHGWLLTCCWCRTQVTAKTKAEALDGMRDHYREVCGREVEIRG